MSIVLTRATKQAARYTDAGGRERCSGCRFFMPQGTCGRIIGPVSPRGWCRFFSQEAVQRWQPGGTLGTGGAAASLDLGFYGPPLDPRITFTRASTATYLDATGTVQTAAVNTPRWEYSGGILRGLLIEESRTNLILQSANYANAVWSPLNATVTANQVVAPDGTTTAARLALAAVSASGSYASVNQNATIATTPCAFSVWLRGNVGGEQVWLSVTPNGVAYQETPRLTLTTSWQRYTLLTTSLGAGAYAFVTGVDFRDTAQGTTPAQTIYAWGAQVEQGTFPTSYIPTVAATVTRALDYCIISSANTAGWFAPPGGSWFAEFINFDGVMTGKSSRIVSQAAATGASPLYEASSFQLGQFDGGATNTSNTVTANVVTKAASSWAPGANQLCLNGGAIASGSLPNGFASLGTSGVAFFADVSGAVADSMSGYLRRVRYWPRVLSAAELQSVTT